MAIAPVAPIAPVQYIAPQYYNAAAYNPYDYNNSTRLGNVKLMQIDAN